MTKVSKKRKYSISVAIATYNGEEYIKEQLESIIDNLKDNDEIIISDDGSTDNTIKIINSFKDDRIKIIDGPHEGVQQNFGNALNQCHGKYIFLADQDDIWLKDKVDNVLEVFEKEKCACVVHDAIIKNFDLSKTIYDSYFRYRKTKNGFLVNLIKPSYLGCCMAINKTYLNYILPIPKKVEMHDRWIGSICDYRDKVVFLDKVLIQYRRHSNNVSKMQRNSAVVIIKNRLYLLLQLLIRK